jgi:hypothetical protein
MRKVYALILALLLTVGQAFADTRFVSGGGTSGTGATVPKISNYAGTFTASGTSTAVVTSAPVPTDHLIAIVYSGTRGADSITQTNVTWTKRYSGNGNNRFIEVWTGVATAGAGTTATFNFTGADTQFCEVFTVDSPNAFTSAVALTTATAAATALATVSHDSAVTGDYILYLCSAANPNSSYGAIGSSGTPLAAFGGASRGWIAIAPTGRVSYWSLSSSAVNFFAAIIKLS